MKVVLIEDSDISDFEEAVNESLLLNAESVKDIKYAVWLEPDGREVITHYSAMIIYE